MGTNKIPWEVKEAGVIGDCITNRVPIGLYKYADDTIYPVNLTRETILCLFLNVNFQQEIINVGKLRKVLYTEKGS